MTLKQCSYFGKGSRESCKLCFFEMAGVLVICKVFFGRALSQCFLPLTMLQKSVSEVWMVFLGGALWLLYMLT